MCCQLVVWCLHDEKMVLNGTSRKSHWNCFGSAIVDYKDLCCLKLEDTFVKNIISCPDESLKVCHSISTLFTNPSSLLVYQIQSSLPSPGDPPTEHRPAASQQRKQRPVLLTKTRQGGGGGPACFFSLSGLHPATAATQPGSPCCPAAARVTGRQPQVASHRQVSRGPRPGPQLLHRAAENHHPLSAWHSAKPASLQQWLAGNWTQLNMFCSVSLTMNFHFDDNQWKTDKYPAYRYWITLPTYTHVVLCLYILRPCGALSAPEYLPCPGLWRALQAPLHQWDTKDPTSRRPAVGAAVWRRTLVGPVPLQCTAGALQFWTTAHLPPRQVGTIKSLIHLPPVA